MKLRLLCAAVVAAAAFAPAAMAQTTEPVTFTLNNNTSHTLMQLYISVARTNDWEEDILGSGVIGAGDSAEVTINDNLSDCVYDLKATFDDGDEVIVARQDFCELDGGEINVNE